MHTASRLARKHGQPFTKLAYASTRTIVTAIVISNYSVFTIFSSSPSSTVSVPMSLSLILMLLIIVTVIVTAIAAALACQKAICVHHVAHSVIKMTHCLVISILWCISQALAESVLDGPLETQNPHTPRLVLCCRRHTFFSPVSITCIIAHRDHQSIFSTLLQPNLVLTLIFNLDHAISAHP